MTSPLWRTHCYCWIGIVSLSAALLLSVQSVPAAAALTSPSQNESAPIVIPFELLRGKIIVQANINGKMYDCNLDTGAFATMWPEYLGIKVEEGTWFTSADPTGNAASLQHVTVPYIKIGDFTAVNYAAIQTDVSPLKHKVNPEGRMPLLSCDLFKKYTLTIDYLDQKITLRKKALSNADKTVKSILLPFETPQYQLVDTYGIPIVDSLLEGRKVRFFLDTGWNDSSIGLTESYYAVSDLKNLPSTTADLNMVYGSAKSTKLSELTFSLAGAPQVGFSGPAYVLKTLYPGVDGVFGYEVLRKYRVTFDFPNKKLLLEPYDAETLRMMQNRTQFVATGQDGTKTISFKPSSIVGKNEQKITITRPNGTVIEPPPGTQITVSADGTIVISSDPGVKKP